MATRTSEREDLEADFLLALKLSEGYDQLGLARSTGQGTGQGCGDEKLDEDYLLALKLSEESLKSVSGYGYSSSRVDQDYILALQLSEGVDQSRGGDGHLESDAAFAKRLQRELQGDIGPEVKRNKPTMISTNALTNASTNASTSIAIVREWYTWSSYGQVSKIGNLFQHLNVLDDVMLRERSGLQLIQESVSRRNISRLQPPTPIIPFQTSGTGFGGGSIVPNSPAPPLLSLVTSNKTPDDRSDQKISAAFDYISANLYDFSGEIFISQERRLSVLHIALAMLDLSLVSETTEAILRSDSIKELSDRKELVRSLLRLLKTLSLRNEYRGILTRPRRLKKHTKGLQGIAQSPIGTAEHLVIIMEDPKEPSSQPLLHLLGRLKVQAEVFLKAVKSFNDIAFQYGEDAVSVKLCEQIVEVHDSILKTIGFTTHPVMTTVIITEKGKGPSLKSPWSSATVSTSQTQNIATPKTLDWSSKILDTHYFKQDALKAMNVTSGRQPKLVRQITELTNLPEGIFVRVMEARPDVLKALIVGPKDTPYEGGLFEFDIFAPFDFPNSPPRVILKTTGGGKVRFNPNLYADGKVCLSLINTWQGAPTEQWQPASSTLLQVLVSIQSMIFVPCPYINEPGREAQAGLLASTQHQEFVRANTIRWGMMGWCQDLGRKDGIWKDVVRFHFLTRAAQLRQLVKESAAHNIGIRHFHGNASEDTLVRNFIGGTNLEKELDKCLASIC